MQRLTPVPDASTFRHTSQLPDSPAIPKVLLTVEEAAVALSVGRTYAYHLVMRGYLISVKVGRKRLVPTFALQEFVARRVADMQKGA